MCAHPGLLPQLSLVGMRGLWQQRLPGTRQMGQGTDRGRSLGGCSVGTSGSLPCRLAFLLLRPMEDTVPLEKQTPLRGQRLPPRPGFPPRPQRTQAKSAAWQTLSKELLNLPQPERLGRCFRNAMAPCSMASGTRVQLVPRAGGQWCSRNRPPPIFFLHEAFRPPRIGGE